MRKLILLLVLLKVAAANMVHAQPQALPPALPTAHQGERADASHSILSLTPEVSSVRPGQRIWLAAHFQPIDGWHTYWRNPGDSGMAPDLQWSARDGSASFEPPLYPTPQRLPLGPLMNYGYEGASTLLIAATAPADMGPSWTITLDAEWLVCKIECIPQFAVLTLSIPRGPGLAGIDAAQAGLFAAARARLPEPSYWDSRIDVGADGSVFRLLLTPEEAEGLADVYVFPGSDGIFDFAAEQSWSTSDDGLTVTAPRAPGAVPEAGFALVKLTFDTGEVRAFETELVSITAPVPAATAPVQLSGAPAVSLSILQAVLFALAGGALLNLMPCVFPILSLKAFSLARAGSVADARREGLAYAAGVLASFAALSGGILAIRLGGAAIGWGFQLQEPLFVGALALVMLAVGLSLSGLFEISLGFEGRGQSLTEKSGPLGSFFTGVLATLVATPCTAPLMAPAIGYAMTQPPVTLLAVMMALGVGFALPFLALSYSSLLAKALPKPGPWMLRFKQALAFPMYLTAIWLLYIYTNMMGAEAMVALLVLAVVLVFAGWLGRAGWGRLAPLLAPALAILAVVVFVSSMRDVERASAPASMGTASDTDYMIGAAFSSARLEAARASGKPVFLYFTADWCITCKVNERVALFRADTRSAFQEADVQVLRGDYTSIDPAITAFLSAYNRAGVPFYLYFEPGAEQARILPEILTVGMMTDLVEA